MALQVPEVEAVVALLETTSQWRARLQEAIAVAQAEFGGLGAGGESAGMPPVLMLHDEALVRLLQQGSELEVTPAQELGQLQHPLPLQMAQVQ